MKLLGAFIVLIAGIGIALWRWVTRPCCASCEHYRPGHHYCVYWQKYEGIHHYCSKYKPWNPKP